MAVTYEKTTKRQDPLALLAAEIAARTDITKNILAKTLRELIDGQGEKSHQLRTLLQLHLAEVEVGWTMVGESVLLAGDGAAAVVKQSDPMLTTEEAAELLGCSRPHVAMLIDAGKLVGATKTEGGHRRVSRSAVETLARERVAAATSGSVGSDYRAAARETGMYDVPESQWTGSGAKKRGR